MSIDDSIDLDPIPEHTSRYRPTRPIPLDIREHCHIFFDEQLYPSALMLLSDLVTTAADDVSRAVIAPLPYHIELVSCLLIHPRHTSQAPPDEDFELASKAITFLRNLLSILGPVNANLNEAFSLQSTTFEGRRSQHTRAAADSQEMGNDSDSDYMSESVRGVIANAGRLRRCAKDFWHVVGWAFNCSVKYPRRWKYWKVWLGYMLDVLDADWKERQRLDEEDKTYQSKLKSDSDAESRLEQSLLAQYLSEVNSSRSLKRVVRSAFANGSAESLRDFPGVFPNETKVLRQKGQKRKRGAQPGDNNSENEEELLETATDHTVDSLDECQDRNQAQEPGLGDAESIALRQRLVTLLQLSRISPFLPQKFVTTKLLYDNIIDCTVTLPVPAFSKFLSPSNSFLIDAYISLCQGVIPRLISHDAPVASEVLGGGDDLSQDVLEHCLLPFTANTSSIEDNTKVSILVENMFRILARHAGCDLTPELGKAIDMGIKARESKIKGDRRRGSAKTKIDDTELIWLRSSGQRLRTLYAWVREQGPFQCG